MSCVEEDALTAEMEGVLEEERKENTKQVGAHTRPWFSSLQLSIEQDQESSWQSIITKNILTHKRDALSKIFILEFKTTLLDKCLHR